MDFCLVVEGLDFYQVPFNNKYEIQFFCLSRGLLQKSSPSYYKAETHIFPWLNWQFSAFVEEGLDF